MYIKFLLLFNFLFKRFYFRNNKFYLIKSLSISTNFRLLKKERLRVFIKNFMKLEVVSGYKPVIKKIYAKKIDKKRIELFCILKT